MCISLQTLADGTQTACGHCRRCHDNKINDYVGRCLAEKQTSALTVAITLTYRGVTTDAVILNYRHIQLMLKRLRKDGFSVRYLCAGEYGELRGRAHWHVILFFSGAKIPNFKFGTNDKEWKYWPHGHIFVQNPDEGGFRYAVGYVVKGYKQPGVRNLTMSKYPPLGSEFFKNYADKLVNLGAPLKDCFYSFPASKTKDGNRRIYLMQGAARRDFIKHYIEAWQEKYGEPPFETDLLNEFYDEWLEPDLKEQAQTLNEEIVMREHGFKQRARARDAIRLLHPHFAQGQTDREKTLLLNGDDPGIATLASDGTVNLTTESGKQWTLSKNADGTLSGSDGLKTTRQLLVIAWLHAIQTGSLSRSTSRVTCKPSSGDTPPSP